MRGLRMAVLFAVAVLLTLSTGAVAQGGEELGACLLLNVQTRDEIPGAPFSGPDGGVPPGFNLCIDNVTELFCQCVPDGTGEGGGGQTGECFFLPGETCAQQDIDWDGACGELKGLCIALQSPQAGDSEALCVQSQGLWFPGTTICGGVPTLPKPALAALALVLLAGTLGLLTLFGKRM